MLAFFVSTVILNLCSHSLGTYTVIVCVDRYNNYDTKYNCEIHYAQKKKTSR